MSNRPLVGGVTRGSRSGATDEMAGLARAESVQRVSGGRRPAPATARTGTLSVAGHRSAQVRSGGRFHRSAKPTAPVRPCGPGAPTRSAFGAPGLLCAIDLPLDAMAQLGGPT